MYMNRLRRLVHVLGHVSSKVEVHRSPVSGFLWRSGSESDRVCVRVCVTSAVSIWIICIACVKRHLDIETDAIHVRNYFRTGDDRKPHGRFECAHSKWRWWEASLARTSARCITGNVVDLDRIFLCTYAPSDHMHSGGFFNLCWQIRSLYSWDMQHFDPSSTTRMSSTA